MSAVYDGEMHIKSLLLWEKGDREAVDEELL